MYTYVEHCKKELYFNRNKPVMIYCVPRIQGWIYWGGAGGCTPPLALARWGAGGGAIFMKKQKNMRDIMKYTL